MQTSHCKITWGGSAFSQILCLFACETNLSSPPILPPHPPPPLLLLPPLPSLLLAPLQYHHHLRVARDGHHIQGSIGASNSDLTNRVSMTGGAEPARLSDLSRNFGQLHGKLSCRRNDDGLRVPSNRHQDTSTGQDLDSSQPPSLLVLQSILTCAITELLPWPPPSLTCSKTAKSGTMKASVLPEPV